MPRLVSAGPIRRRRTLFVLTPLIDVLFLLLIFFMLSSRIAPYSLLPVSSATATAIEAPLPDTYRAEPAAVVRIARNQVTLDEERLAFTELEPAFARRVAAGGVSFVVLPSRSATVQDLVTVLEALRAASASSVTLVGTGS